MNPIFSNKTYDKLKFVSLILLPALAAAYFSLAGVWHLPAADKIVGTTTVIDTLLGVLLGLSTKRYSNAGGTSSGMSDGDLVLQRDGEETYMGLAVNESTFNDISNKETVMLRVVDTPTGNGKTESN